MVTQVTLGNFFTSQNGRTVVGGLGGSGLPTEDLIKSLVEARTAAAVQYQDQIDVNDKRAEALTTFNQLLSAYQSATDALRNPAGVGNAADNVFKFTTASVSASGVDYFNVSTEPGATLQSYTVSEITSLATYARQSSGTFTVDSADDSVVPPDAGTVQFAAGTITFNGEDITIEEDDSLNLIAAKFNAVSDGTGVVATVIKIADGAFKLSFTATETGDDNDFDLSTATDPDGVLDDVGLSVAAGADNALFKFNGLSIERQSNVISDVVTGVTLTLLQETPDATLHSFAVQPDTITTQNSVVNYVSAYNALKIFAAQQTQIDSSGEYADTAVLANDQTFRLIINEINAQVVSQVKGITGSNPSSLADIGISFTTRPADDETPETTILNVNDGKLSTALANNFSGVSRLFGFYLSSNNANLAVFSHTNALSVAAFTLDIDPGTDTFEATYNPGSGPVTVSLTAVALAGSVGGYTLTGPAGSALEGLVLIYASEDAATIDVTATQGLADRAYVTSESATRFDTGTIAIAQQTIKENSTRLQTNIDQVEEQGARYQDLLIRQFAALEQTILQINTLLSGLAQNDNARLAASSFS